MIVQVLGGTRGLDIASTAVPVWSRRPGWPSASTARANPSTVGRRSCPMPSAISTDYPSASVARAHPAEFIETGIPPSTAYTPWSGPGSARFFGYGLPGLHLATRIAEGARAPGSGDGLVVVFAVFAAIGVTDREAASSAAASLDTAALKRSVVFINRADEPTAERRTCPRSALTTANTSPSTAICMCWSSSST